MPWCHVCSVQLGVQVSMLCYRLLGGGTTNPTLQPYTYPSRYAPGGKANMFSYKGPRHVKVAGLWDEQGLTAGSAPDGTLDPDLLKVIASDCLRLPRIASECL